MVIPRKAPRQARRSAAAQCRLLGTAGGAHRVFENRAAFRQAHRGHL